MSPERVRRMDGNTLQDSLYGVGRFMGGIHSSFYSEEFTTKKYYEEGVYNDENTLLFICEGYSAPESAFSYL